MAFSKARRLSDFIAADGSIPTGKFASSTITSAHLVDGTVAHADLHTNMDLTGKTVLVSTQSASDNDTSAASTAYVTTAIANLVDSAPGTMNTLNEIAAALNDDANFNTTVTNAIAAKLPLAGGTLTGDLVISSANSPKITITDTTNTTTMLMYSQDGDSIIGTYSNHPLKLFSNSGLGLTLDTSQNATFAGDVQATGLYVGSTNTSYDFYNNGTSYFNGAVTVDDNITVSGGGGIVSGGDLTIDIAGELIIDTDLQGSGNGILLKDGGTLYGSIFRSSSHLHIKAEAQDKNLLFLTNSGGTERTSMTIDYSGRVGINRTPSISNSKLEVGGADDVSLINVEASGNTGGLGIGSTGLKLFHGSSAKMTIDSNGNVGIGTQSPQGKLDVDGDLRITSNIVSNTVYQMLSFGSDRAINDYGGLNKDYWRVNLATPGPSTDGGSSAHAFGTLIFSSVTGSNTTYADRLAITPGGFVGIGTNVPNVGLTLNQSAVGAGLHYNFASAKGNANHITIGYEADGSTHSAGFISSQNGLPLQIKDNGTTRITVQQHSVNLNHRVTMPASNQLFKYVGMQSPNLMTWEGMNHVDSVGTYPAGNNTRNDGGNVGGQSNAMGVYYGMNQQDARNNKWKFSSTPKGTRDIVWQGTAAYSGGSGGDAGWGCNFPMDFRRSYLYTTYIRRVSSAGDGSFYFGCHNCRYNSGGTITNESNPYFVYFGTGSLVRYEWYLCYFVIRGNEDSAYSGTVPFNGVWQLSNGTRLRGPATTNIGNGAIQPTGTTGNGVHRTYLYYAGGGNSTTLQWYNPGVYLIDGTEPSLNQLLGVHADLSLTSEWPTIDNANNSWTSN